MSRSSSSVRTTVSARDVERMAPDPHLALGTAGTPGNHAGNTVRGHGNYVHNGDTTDNTHTEMGTQKQEQRQKSDNRQSMKTIVNFIVPEPVKKQARKRPKLTICLGISLVTSIIAIIVVCVVEIGIPNMNRGKSNSQATNSPANLSGTSSQLQSTTSQPTSSTSSPSSTSTSSAPIPPPTRKQADGCYLVDCHKTTTDDLSSGIAYYKYIQDNGGNIGQQPDDYQDVVQNTHVNWIGAGSVTFESTNVTFEWNVDADAASQGVNASVGSAGNGFEVFGVYKDGGETLYQRDGWSCQSMYWAF